MTLILTATRSPATSLLALVVWSAARLYYFLFYVLEQYVDPTLKYSGLIALLRELMSRGGRGPR